MGMSENFAIRTEELTKLFGSLVAVDHVSLEIPPGEIFGFLGPNGAGKTTLIRMLCGILKPTSGRGWVGGYDIDREAEKVKTQIGYMSQHFSLYDDLTVEENLSFYAHIHLGDRRRAQRQMEKVIEVFQLGPRLRQLTRELSGGWKQRLALASAVVHEPQILFLDEPTVGIDPVSRREIWDLIYELSGRGTTVFLTTHYMDEAERCHRIGFIYSGRLVALDTPEEIKRRRMVGEVLDVQCTDLAQGLQQVKAADFVLTADLYGNSLHVVVPDASVHLPQVRKLLESRGNAVRRIEAIDPSIEDVFMMLTMQSA